MKKNSIKSFRQLVSYAKPWRFKIIIASIYSIVNKLFDIMPEILIGFAVDLVVKRQDSFIASLGFTSVESQISILAICTFFIWAFESLFQYLYSISWRNLAQTVEHEIRTDAYDHVQNLRQHISPRDDFLNRLTSKMDGKEQTQWSKPSVEKRDEFLRQMMELSKRVSKSEDNIQHAYTDENVDSKHPDLSRLELLISNEDFSEETIERYSY